MARYQAAWDVLDISYDRFIRTTEPGHYAAVTKLLQACYDAGDIELDTYRGWYSVSDEEYIGADEVEDYRARGRKVIELEEENYFFRLSRFQDRLLKWYEDHPDVIHPVGRRNEVLGLIKGGLLDFSISRTSLEWGVPIPWDERHVTYVWFDALTNYITAAGYGQPDEATEFAKWWPAVHLIGKDIIRFHCVYWPAMLLSAGVEPPRDWHVHGWLLVGGEKMSKTALNQIAPADLVADFGVDGYRYHFLRRLPVRRRRRLQLRGHGRPLQRRPGQQPRQPAEPRRHRRGQEVRRRRAGAVGPTARCAAAAADRRRRTRRGVGRGPAERGPRGHLAAHPRDQRLPRGQRAVEGRARPRRRRGCWATPSRRCASWPSWPRRPSRTTAQAIWDRIGLPGALGRPAPARGRGLGRLPRRPDGDEGRAALPPPDGLT